MSGWRTSSVLAVARPRVTVYGLDAAHRIYGVRCCAARFRVARAARGQSSGYLWRFDRGAVWQIPALLVELAVSPDSRTI
jgi:hypothetical protein